MTYLTDIRTTAEIDDGYQIDAFRRHLYLKTENTWKVLPSYKFRFTCHNNSDTVWDASFILHMFRKSTLDY